MRLRDLWLLACCFMCAEESAIVPLVLTVLCPRVRLYFISDTQIQNSKNQGYDCTFFCTHKATSKQPKIAPRSHTYYDRRRSLPLIPQPRNERMTTRSLDLAPLITLAGADSKLSRRSRRWKELFNGSSVSGNYSSTGAGRFHHHSLDSHANVITRFYQLVTEFIRLEDLGAGH